VLSYGTCTDTGRLADLLAAISGELGGVPISSLPGVTGGILNVETDAVKAVDGIASHIEMKRKGLGI
jgi:carbon-monoxide dehydrogenase catalytic subunit